MQSIPLAVLKQTHLVPCIIPMLLHAIHTACGIETWNTHRHPSGHMQLHAIHTACGIETTPTGTNEGADSKLHAIHTACGIETLSFPRRKGTFYNCMQSIPLAVLKLLLQTLSSYLSTYCMQSIPLAVLKQNHHNRSNKRENLLHAIHTACGIETIVSNKTYCLLLNCMQSIPLAVLKQRCMS